jgi:uncharacterized protein (AIM24 family)
MRRDHDLPERFLSLCRQGDLCQHCFAKEDRRGLFGGEGFIMQKLEGDGLAFMHAGGPLRKKDLLPQRDDSFGYGHAWCDDETICYDIRFSGNIKTALLWRRGPGPSHPDGPPRSVWLQSLPFPAWRTGFMPPARRRQRQGGKAVSWATSYRHFTGR